MAVSPRGRVYGASFSQASTKSPIDGLLAEFSDRWARGESPRAEEYLGRLRESENSEEGALELVYHEYCLAEQSGLEPDPSSFLERFPSLRGRLRNMLDLHRVIDSASQRLRSESRLEGLPEPGDEVGPYHLVRELGRGGFARVYLARQADLSDRLVVVKISRRAGVEPQLLARARHPHIVEVLRHAEADDGAMHLVCMPFLGGSTLQDVLKVARARGRRPRSGRAFLSDLDEVSAPEFPGHAAEGPVRETLERLSYPRAAAWVVARLAEALDHAHRQGVTHGDLKPSNVLVAADGRPMLLDFNLSLDWRSEDDGRSSPGGGTLAYMAPERLRALVSPGRSREAPSPMSRHRADLYALGFVLLEMLTGEPPSVPEDTGGGNLGTVERLAEARSLMDLNVVLGRSSVPSGLRPVLKRCLAPDPADRYSRGRELAADLECWRKDRPLLVADEPSLPARLGRWARSRRWPLLVGCLMLAAGAIAELATSRVLNGSQAERARSKLELFWSGAEPGVYRFLAPTHWEADETLDPQTARRQRAAYGLVGPEAADWRERPDVAALPEMDQEDLGLWLLDRTWSEAVARLGRSGDDEAEQRRVLADLERVPEWASLKPVLELRRKIRHSLHLPDPWLGRDRSAPSCETDYLGGLAEEPRNASKALEAYRRVLEIRPESYWAHYRAASMCFRLGRYDEAAEHLDHCLSRRPRVGALHAQKAACLFLTGDDSGSLRESNLAIELDPDQPHSYRNRAFVRARKGQTDRLEADLRRFSSLMDPRSEAAPWEVRLQTLFQMDKALPVDALTVLETSLSGRDVEVRTSLGAMFDDTNQPRRALEQYDRVIETDPDHLIARFRRANLRLKLGDSRAPEDFAFIAEHPRIEELVREQPEALRALHMQAAYLASRNQGREAVATAQRSLNLASRLHLPQGESHYALARAYASLAGRIPGAEREAMRELELAREANHVYHDVWYRKDTAFDPVRAYSLTIRRDPDDAVRKN